MFFQTRVAQSFRYYAVFAGSGFPVLFRNLPAGLFLLHMDLCFSASPVGFRQAFLSSDY